MKTFLQSESAECGIACLAMIFDAHGLSFGLSELRRRHPPSSKGTKLSHLIFVSQRCGFSARPLRLEPEELRQIQLPCILHWDFSHFVVLSRIDKKKAIIHDPAVGERHIKLPELSEHFTGVALELAPNADFTPQKPARPVSIRQLTGTISGLWRSLLLILSLSVSLQIFAVLTPFFLQWIVDQVLVAADRDLLTLLVLGFTLALLLQLSIGFARGWAVIYLSSSLGLQWMGNVFAHLFKLPLAYFEKRHLGDITSRISSIQAIQRTLTTSFVEAIIDGMMASVTFVLMLIYSWKLALITSAAVSIYCFIRTMAYRPLRDGTERQLFASAKQQTHLLESLRGMQSLKLAGEEAQRQSTYTNLMVDTVNQEIRLARMGLGFNTASQLVFGIERIVVIWIGALLTLQSIFSVGMLIAFLAYKDQFAQRMSALIDKWIEFRMLRLHGERLSELILADTEDETNEGTVSLRDTSIVVENLSFRYSDSDSWILKDCSFTVESGESVALIGPSGCGKTTLLKLLLGLLQPTSGKIFIGGHDMKVVGARALRAHMGAVMQDDQLFAGSIADNINFFSEFDQHRLERAAKAASIHDEISSMPMGYSSLIGDMGSALSGGQKQRVILARALYRSPKLLLLDEATSHLDVANEHAVNDALNLMNLTKLVVAHRPETIKSAKRCLVLAEGAVTQQVI